MFAFVALSNEKKHMAMVLGRTTQIVHRVNELTSKETYGAVPETDLWARTAGEQKAARSIR
jgi:hypothetical protein